MYVTGASDPTADPCFTCLHPDDHYTPPSLTHDPWPWPWWDGGSETLPNYAETCTQIFPRRRCGPVTASHVRDKTTRTRHNLMCSQRTIISEIKTEQDRGRGEGGKG